ncbi:MAG TPA: hypothetical protein VFE62_15675 [Gemmataceae bacterium]|nr:hypothetical protein [Gemmataceae bacterium]
MTERDQRQPQSRRQGNVHVDEQLREAEQTRRDLEAHGWKWQDHEILPTLTHPDDPDVSISFDPWTGEELLSPKLGEWLVQIARAERKQLPDGGGKEP